MFQVAATETGNGLDACGGCELLPTKPGNESSEVLEENELFDEIAELIDEADGGNPPDFDTLGYEIWKLFLYWRNTERQIEQIWKVRHQAWLRGQFEPQK